MDTNENKITSDNRVESSDFENEFKSDLHSVNATEDTHIESRDKTDFLADIISKATSMPEVEADRLHENMEEYTTLETDNNIEDAVSSHENVESTDSQLSSEDNHELTLNIGESSEAIIPETEKESDAGYEETLLKDEVNIDDAQIEPECDNEALKVSEKEHTDGAKDFKQLTQSISDEKSVAEPSKKKQTSSKKKIKRVPRSLIMEYIYHWYVILISLMMCLPAFLLEILLGNLLLAKGLSPFWAAMLTMFIGGFIATLPLLILNIILVVRKKYYAIAVQLVAMQLIGMAFYVYSKISLGIG